MTQQVPTSTAPAVVPPLGQDEQFVKNEKVLVFHGAMLYEATIMRVNESRPRKPYFLKFTGFGSKYNTWAGSDILIKDLPENRLYQDELKANLQQSQILKNMGKIATSDASIVVPAAAVSAATLAGVPDTSSSDTVLATQVTPHMPANPVTTVAVVAPSVEEISTALISIPTPEAISVITPIALETASITLCSLGAAVDSRQPHSASLVQHSSALSAFSRSPASTSHDNEDTETDNSEEEALCQTIQEGKLVPQKKTKGAKKRSQSVVKDGSERTPKKSAKVKSKDQLQTPKSHKKKKTDASTPSSVAPAANVKLYCLCKKPELWPMIGCDTCADWFHLSCVGLTPSDTDSMDTYACPTCKG